MREARAITLGNETFPAILPEPAVSSCALPVQVQQEQQVADVVRNAYVSLYRDATGKRDYGQEPIPAWDGGIDQFGHRHTRPVWPKIAAVIMQIGADPLEYLRAQFVRRKQRKPPAPNTLFNQKAVELWHDYCQDRKVIVGRQLKSDQNALVAGILPLVRTLGWTEQRAVCYCLQNTTSVSMSPLFRYCTAMQYGFRELADCFAEKALVQYTFQQADFDTVWGQFVPVDFKVRAEDLRARMVGNCQYSPKGNLNDRGVPI